MKGVVLAGGRGTRLRPTTAVLNKHIIPVYDKPMIFYPVSTLLNAGIDQILVISNAEHIGKYIELLEDNFEADFHYKVQSEPEGIAHAVALADDFVDDQFAVILGDNILIGGDVSEEIHNFDGDGAKVFLKDVDTPSAYGVATVRDGSVQALREKPTDPESNLAVIGLYLYTDEVFDIIEGLTPSDRGEYEITDVNNAYIDKGKLKYAEYEGAWFDAGTPEGIYSAATKMRDLDR